MLLRNWYNKIFFEKLDKKDFVRWLIQEILDKKTGVTFWTFGVEHYVLEENMVPYEKNMRKSQIS
jgi:hypothetical protein